MLNQPWPHLDECEDHGGLPMESRVKGEGGWYGVPTLLCTPFLTFLRNHHKVVNQSTLATGDPPAVASRAAAANGFDLDEIAAVHEQPV